MKSRFRSWKIAKIRPAGLSGAWLSKLWQVAYLLVVSGVLFALFSNWAYDDPFITYRYARNLAAGRGFVYNPGERVLSTTTPLFTLLLAGFSFIYQDIPRMANLIGVLGLALGGLAIWQIAHTLSRPWVGWAGLCLYPVFPLLLITIGSEMPLFLALCLGLYWLNIRDRYIAMAICGAFAVLTRPDALLVVGILFVHRLIFVKKPFPSRAVSLFLGLLSLWILFSRVYFTSPLPVTLAAKQAQGALPVGRSFLQGFSDIILSAPQNIGLYLGFLLAALGTVVFLWQGQRRYFLLFAWPMAHTVAYTLLGVSAYFWYYAPLVPAYIVLIGLGLEWAARSWKRMLGRLGRPIFPFWYFAFPVLLFGIVAVGQIVSMRTILIHSDRRIRVYEAAGAWLSVNLPPQAQVAALEIGVIGYYAPQQFVDFAGLLQSKVTEYLSTARSYEQVADWVVESFRPQGVVLYGGWQANMHSPYFHTACRLSKRYDGVRYGYWQDLEIYLCDDEG